MMVREDIAVGVQNHATADTAGVLILALGGDGHDGGPVSYTHLYLHIGTPNFVIRCNNVITHYMT